PTLAQWHQPQWAHLGPGRTIEDWVATFQKHLLRRSVPSTFVALAGGVLLGSAAIIAYDLESRRDLSPWLACVLVAPEHRGKGIGTALVKRTVIEARDLGFPRLYLYTVDREGFYARMGWSVVERTTHLEYDIVVMEIDTAAPEE
ncbi:MAG: GNAT family N-acetyltransferase, partial [Chloroflexi bacterium]|nr:GNAT family N-acetyltransferase [Chloroflexota bacterium]